MVRKIITRHLEDKTFPGIVLKVEKDGKPVFTITDGFARVNPEQEIMTEDEIFDLASVTKPLATTTSFLALCEAESIVPEKRKAGDFIPELNDKAADLTLASLMTHTSGLPPVPEIFRLFNTEDEIDREKALAHLYSLVPEQTPGTGVLYSCSGYILLTRILERIAGCSLSEVFSRLVTRPAALEGLFFCPAPELRERCAATENDPWRGRILQGEVHDENSWCFGGEGGNAGLFGTAESVALILELFLCEGVLNDKQILSPEHVRRMTTCQTPGVSPHRAWGFLTQDDPESLAGPGFSENAFGHSGFTGTSVWVDPERQLKVVTLTNRVHYGRESTANKIKIFRKELHQELLKAFS